MKNNLLLLFLLLLGSWANALAVPPLVNYAGRVAVKGQPFEGTGQLKFALVNASGNQTYWSNDGTSVNGSEPTAHVSVQVNGGLYSILLGNTAITGMSALDVSVFRTHSDVKLRVWFNDGKNGFQQLSPDRPFSSVPYALSAGSVKSGAGSTKKTVVVGYDDLSRTNKIYLIDSTVGSQELLASFTFPSGAWNPDNSFLHGNILKLFDTEGDYLNYDLSKRTWIASNRILIPNISVQKAFSYVSGEAASSGGSQNSNTTPRSALPYGADFIGVVGNNFYFADANDLWVTDGSTTSTLLKHFSGGPGKGTVVGNLLYFVADDGVRMPELWKSDGTVNGTSLVKDIAPGANSSSPSGLTAVGNLLFFTADDGTHGRKSWKSDGTSGGTLLAENTPTPTPIGTQVGDKFLVATSYGSNSGIFIRDPVSGSLTQLIAPLGGATTNHFFGKNLVYAQSAEGKTWKSDGTLSGTSLVNISFPWSARVVGDSLYWTELDGYDYKLMKLDGSTTSMVKNFGRDHALTNLSVYGNYLLFDHRAALWKSDGTEAGTVMIKSGAGTSSIFHSTGNTIYLKTGSSIETINLAAH